MAGDLEEVQDQLENRLHIIDHEDSLGLTAVANCVLFGRLNVFEYLVEKGANVNLCDLVGNAPLQFAAMTGRFVFVQRLLLLGVNPRYCNLKDENAAQLAMRYRHEPLAAYILWSVEVPVCAFALGVVSCCTWLIKGRPHPAFVASGWQNADA